MAKKIVVVEDEGAQLLSITAQLRAYGFDVSPSSTAEDGLRKVIEGQPDLVLMDLMLPGMTGIELCQRLKDLPATKDIPIIFVTASGMSGLQERCKALGASACVTKPYQIQHVLQTIQQIVPEPIPRTPSS